MSATSRRRDRDSAVAPVPPAGPLMEEATAAAEEEDPMVVHERLVAYVHAINGDPEPRVGVWMEHSYAAAKGGAGGGAGGGGGAAAAGEAGHTRTLLVGGARSPPRGDLDVETVEASPPAPHPPSPPSPSDSDDSEDSAGEEDPWEARLESSAPSVAARGLLLAALGALRALRLARLAGGGVGRREEVRAAARSLRRALATQWGAGGAAGWLHASLSAAPTRWRRLYRAVLAELARAVPALVARLPAPAAPPPAPAPAPRAPPACMPMSSRPLLVWVGGGCEAEDARWERRLRALVPTHYVRLPTVEARDVVSWCGAAAAAARAALAGVAGGGGCSLLAVGGAGPGAALALQLACPSSSSPGAMHPAPPPPPPPPPPPRVAALLLLAPPLLTAEGPRTAPDDPVAELSIPTLAVVPEQSAGLWWQATSGGAAGYTRTVVVGGADELLRVSLRRRRRLRLPQHALDHAIVEECARWLTDLAETDALGRQHKGADVEMEEYSHLPPPGPPADTAPAPPPPPPPPLRAPHLLSKGSSRAIEIVEGRVVSRVCGGTPLALPPPAPRRAPALAPVAPAPAPAPAPHSPADIMSMPIVFADDDPVPSASAGRGGGGGGAGGGAGGDVKGAPTTVTVKSGGGPLKYSKVIVAKRGVAGVSGGAGGAGGAGRPIVVRGGVRLVRSLHRPGPPAPAPAPAPAPPRRQ